MLTVAAMSFGGVRYFMSRAEGQELVQRAQQQTQQARALSVRDYLGLKVELLRQRVLLLTEKSKLSADERLELDFSREQVKHIQEKLLAMRE